MIITVTRNETDREIRYALKGHLTAEFSQGLADLKKMVKRDLAEKPIWRYLLDCDKLESLDSSGIGMLLYLKTEISEYKGEFALVNIPRNIRAVLTMTMMDRFFTFAQNSA